MANSYRGRSPPRELRGGRDPVSEYRSANDPYRRSSLHSRSPPDRDRRSVPLRNRDSQYGFPGENNYRPRYSPSPPPIRSNSIQSSKVSSARAAPTNERIHTNKTHVVNPKADEPNNSTMSNSRTPEDSAAIEQLGEEAAKALGPHLQQLIRDLVNCSTLKLHQSNAQNEFDKRSAEFNGSAKLHEKFPAMAETQTRSKARAESELKTISETVGVIESSLNNLAAQSVRQVIPQILAATTRQHGPQLGLEELERKCEDFQKQLEDSRKQSKAQELLLENLEKSNNEKDRLVEDKFGVLLKRFEELQKRSEIQERCMNDLQKSHEERYKALEDRYSKLSDECSHTKSRLNNDCLPQLSSTVVRVIEMERSMTALSEDFVGVKQLTTRLDSEMPANLRARLEKLGGLTQHVSTLPKLKDDVTNIKQEAEKSRLDFAKHMNNIVQLPGYYVKINSLDYTINGGSSMKGLGANVSQLLKASEAVSQELKLINGSAISALEARLNKVTTQISDVNKLSGTLSELQRNVVKFDDRLRVAETRKTSAPLTPPLDSAALSRISQLDNKTIPALDESISRVTARCSALEDTLSALQRWKEGQDNHAISGVKDTSIHREMDYETLKQEILEVADDKQAAADEVTSKVFTQLWTAVGNNENRLKAIEESMAEMKTAYGPLIALPEQLQQLTASLELKAKQQLDVTTNNVFDLIRLRPELLPLDFLERYILKSVEIKLEPVTKTSFQSSLQSMNDILESHSDGLIASERRLNNINTRSMALFIIEQIESVYPDVRNVQDFISDFRAKFSRVDASLENSTSLLNTVQTQVGALEARVSKTGSSDSLLQSLRGEVDGLACTIGKIQGTANSAKMLSDIANEGVVTAKDDNTKFQEDIAGEMGSFRIDLEEVKTAVQNIKTKTVLSAPDRSSAAIPSRSVSASISSTHSTSGRFRSPKGQPFISGNLGNKKRKLNGVPPSAPAGPPEVPSSSSKKKRHRFRVNKVDEDDSEDSNFEPNQPSISDEDDES